jgi:hypothetical protein
MSLDLNKLENKLDEALSNETSETLNKFLNDKRMENNKQQTAVTSIWSICDDFYEENIDNSNIPREHWEYEIKALMIDFAIYYNETYGGNK